MIISYSPLSHQTLEKQGWLDDSLIRITLLAFLPAESLRDLWKILVGSRRRFACSFLLDYVARGRYLVRALVGDRTHLRPTVIESKEKR